MHEFIPLSYVPLVQLLQPEEEEGEIDPGVQAEQDALPGKELKKSGEHEIQIDANGPEY